MVLIKAASDPINPSPHIYIGEYIIGTVTINQKLHCEKRITLSLLIKFESSIVTKQIDLEGG